MKTPIKILLQLSVVVLAFLPSCEESIDEERPVVLKDRIGRSNERLASNYKFTGQEGDPISYEIARQWVTNYQEMETGGNMAHFFGYEIIKDILALEGCMGIRIYYAVDDEGNRQLILVGVDEDGQNLIPGESGRTKEEGIVADASFPCPSHCSGGGTTL